MIAIFSKPIDLLEAADIDDLLRQGIPEGSYVEYKGSLPNKRGGQDQWYHGSNQIEEYARNQLLAEIVAFANSYGGNLIIGVEESSRRPPVAQFIQAVPRCAELAEKLRLQARDCIEPQLPAINTKGIPTHSDGSGVVVVRIPRSLAAPHRLRQTLECYYRRADRAERLTMREIQELTLSRSRESQLVEQRFNERRELFHTILPNVAEGLEDYPINAIRCTLIPVGADLYTGRLFNHQKIRPFYGVQKASSGDRELILQLPHLSPQARPILRGVRFKDDSSTVKIYQDILENGIVDYWLLDVVDKPECDAIYPELIMGIAVNAILTAHRVRHEAGSPGAEYGVELELFRHPGGKINVAQYGSSSRVHVAGELSKPTVFPRLSFTDPSEVSAVISILERDLWNSIGREPGGELTVEIPDTLLE